MDADLKAAGERHVEDLCPECVGRTHKDGTHLCRDCRKPWPCGAARFRDALTAAEAELVVARSTIGRLTAEKRVAVDRLTALLREAETDRDAAYDSLETCGAWGGCTLPPGHNMGNADVPAAHDARRQPK